jgi:hypothetical protein
MEKSKNFEPSPVAEHLTDDKAERELNTYYKLALLRMQGVLGYELTNNQHLRLRGYLRSFLSENKSNPDLGMEDAIEAWMKNEFGFKYQELDEKFNLANPLKKVVVLESAKRYLKRLRDNPE